MNMEIMTDRQTHAQTEDNRKTKRHHGRDRYTCVHTSIAYASEHCKEGTTNFQLLLLSSFIGKNPMSDRTRIHVHSLKLNSIDTQTVGPIL